MTRYIEQESHGAVRFAAITMLPGALGGPPLEQVEEAIRSGSIDRVFITDFENSIREVDALVIRLTRLAVDITIIPKLAGISAPLRRIDLIGGSPVIDVSSRPLSRLQAAAKRIEDLVLAGFCLVLVTPVFLLISIAIRLDTPGPLFFRQSRMGFHDRPFKVWKFRTMHHSQRDEAAQRQTRRADPRVTRVGRFLRRTSLDELPQLLNVISGEMSIVGPRPHALGMTVGGREMHELTLEYVARHRVKPGITGWAQISGYRGEVDTLEKLRQRVTRDCYYIENWSLGFDLWIILRTLPMLLFDKTAY
jgi:Undecaprenyl-phosphate glucose phosphotransferase